MAKDYRTIKFTYNAVTYEIDVKTDYEEPNPKDISQGIQAIDGTRYIQITGQDNLWAYGFPRCDKEVFDFFNNAYEYRRNTGAVTFEREEDDGTYTSYNVIISRPQYKDDSITTDTDQKVYNNFSCEVYT